MCSSLPYLGYMGEVQCVELAGVSQQEREREREKMSKKKDNKQQRMKMQAAESRQ
jgi:hypothetical protein